MTGTLDRIARIEGWARRIVKVHSGQPFAPEPQP